MASEQKIGLCTYLKSSIGQKFFMALTGFGLALFVLTHMLGNMLLFVGPEAYNSYSYALMSNPFIYVAEIGLLAAFLGHVVLAVALTIRNRKARPQKYAVKPNGEKAVSCSSQTMIYHGIIILVFLVYHIVTFKYGPNYSVNYNGVEMRDLYSLILEVFKQPLYVVWYVISVGLLGFHLSHGLQSLFQSLGFHHSIYSDVLKKISIAYGIIVGLGFMIQPIYVFFVL